METLHPKLRFPEFEREWSNNKLQKLLKIYDGTHQTPNYVENGIPFYSVEHLTANQFENTKYISEEVFGKENKRVKLERNDILMTRIGSIGVAKLIDWDVQASFYVSLALLKKSENIINKYLVQFINTPFFQNELWKRTIHVAFPQKINLGEIGDCIVKFPSKEEQTKIANFLSAVDEKLNLLKEKKALLEDYKKGIMQKIFNQEIRFKDDNGNDFDDWKETTLGEIAEIKRGAASQHLNYVNNSSDGIRLLRINDFLSDDAVYVQNTSEIQRFKVKTGDLLIAGTGATAGIIFTVPEKFDNLPFSYNAPRIKILNDYNKFIYYYLKSDLILIQQKKLFVGNAQPFLDTNAMRGFRINLPSINEQTKIANFLSAIDIKIELVSNQIQDLQEYKKGLLQQMFV